MSNPQPTKQSSATEKNAKEKEIIAKNFEHYIKMVETKLSNRNGSEKLLEFLQAHVGEFACAPAATHLHYGGAYDGGMVEVSLQTLKFAAKLNVAYEANIPADSLVACSLLSLIGSHGTDQASFFLFNDSEWHRKNQGAIFTINPKLANLSVPNLSLWRLGSLGFQLSPEELQVIQTMGYDKTRYLTAKENQSSNGAQDTAVSWLTLVINQAYAATCATTKNRTSPAGFDTPKTASK
jgi:hypothetical protein